jgi:hypothetical protein
MTFEYCLKSPEELKEMVEVSFEELDTIPFQTQITYQTLDGMKCMRAITKMQEVTFEKEEAHKAANINVISVNAVQKSAQMAEKGQFRGAQANAFHWKNAMRGMEGYDNYKDNIAPMYSALQKQQVSDLQQQQPMSYGAGMNYQAPKKQKNLDNVVSNISKSKHCNFKKMFKK